MSLRNNGDGVRVEQIRVAGGAPKVTHHDVMRLVGVGVTNQRSGKSDNKTIIRQSGLTVNG